MMPTNQTKEPNWFRRTGLTASLLVISNLAFAQTASNTQSITAGEILMYIGGITFIVLIAWLAVGKGKSEPNHDHANRKHYDHPHDPHFRKLKRKSS
jgi:hypothetical protein